MQSYVWIKDDMQWGTRAIHGHAPLHRKGYSMNIASPKLKKR